MVARAGWGVKGVCSQGHLRNACFWEPRFFSYKRIKKLLVGAVGIENNNAGVFRDLRGMRRSTKSLKRNDRERKGIPIAPLKLPRFSSRSISLSRDLLTASIRSRLPAQILRRGWQADALIPNEVVRKCRLQLCHSVRYLLECGLVNAYSDGRPEPPL